MSTLAIGPHHRETPMLIVPSTAGFPLLVKSAGACHRGPRSAAAQDSTGTESDWQRRWELEWERRNVED
jgi:hypothetical protein